MLGASDAGRETSPRKVDFRKEIQKCLFDPNTATGKSPFFDKFEQTSSAPKWPWVEIDVIIDYMRKFSSDRDDDIVAAWLHNMVETVDGNVYQRYGVEEELYHLKSFGPFFYKRTLQEVCDSHLAKARVRPPGEK